MRPESTSVSFRTDLAAFAVEYMDGVAAQKFIGRRAAPVFNSNLCSCGYPIFNKESFKKPATISRAMGAKYNRITGEFGKGTFDCVEHGIEYPIDDRRRALYSTLFDAEQAATKILTSQMLMGHESRVAGLYSGASFTNHNVTTAWSTSATAVPLDDLLTGIEALEDNCGCSPAEVSLIIPRADFREFMACTQITNKIMYTYPGMQPALLQPQQVASMLGIKEVLIARSAYDSTEEGYTESMAQFWTAGQVYLAILAGENDPLEMPSATRTVIWTANAPELPVIETYRDDTIKSDIVRARDDTDEILQIVKDIMVYRITNT